jgi:hypothetical protein
VYLQAHDVRRFSYNASECLGTLATRGLAPDAIAVDEAIGLFSATRTLLLGDSTMENKWAYLRAMGVPSSCAGGNGVCFIRSEGAKCVRGDTRINMCKRHLEYNCVDYLRWHGNASAAGTTATLRSDRGAPSSRVNQSRGVVPWDLVAWNGGALHSLGWSDEEWAKLSEVMVRHDPSMHRYNNARPKTEQDAERRVRFTASLEACGRGVSSAFPGAVHVHVLANHICSSRFDGALRTASEARSGMNTPDLSMGTGHAAHADTDMLSAPASNNYTVHLNSRINRLPL